jgi:hypothetical protein
VDTRIGSLAPVMVVVDRGGSDAAVRFGTAEALRTGRPIRLVHVAPVGDGWLRLVGQDSLRIALRRAEAEVAGRVRVHGSLVRGNLQAELTRAAQAAALVVVQQVLTSSLRRPFESTPALGLAATVDVPLAVIPDGWIEKARGVVTVGVEADAPDDVALTSAMSLARLRRAALRVVVAGACSPREVEDRLERLGADACDVAVEWSSGSLSSALKSVAATSDVLVIGRQMPAGPTGSRVGVVGRELLDQLECPLLMTPPGHARPGSAPGERTDEGEGRGAARAGDHTVIRRAG